jgi:hypothetical protein
MRKHLGLIAIAGFVAAVLLLIAAWRMGGGGTLGDMAMRLSQARLPLCAEEAAGKSMSREIAWTGGETVSVDIPADIENRPGDSDQMLRVTGDAALIPHIVVQEGEIKLDCRPGRLNAARIRIALPGQNFMRFNLAGLTSLTLRDIDQPELHFNLAGKSSVTASGKADSLSINGAGLAEANLGGLSVRVAHLNLAGKSTVEVAASDALELNSVGASTLTLVGEPKTLKTNILGTSRIIHQPS